MNATRTAAGELALLLACALATPPNTFAQASSSPEKFAAYASWIPVAGDAHRHAGTAYSLVALERAVAKQGKCPHEFGHPLALFESARTLGFDWLSLSYHVGVGNIVKPDYTPHRLVGSPNDPAYQWWTTPGRLAVDDGKLGHPIRPSPKGFPDYAEGGVVSPPYNEALSLSSAARAASEEGEFAAFAGREFTTASFVAHGGRAGEGGHKTVIFPGDTHASCGVTGSPEVDRNCEGEMDLYRWALKEKAIIIQAHPGDKPKLVRFSKRSDIGGFSDLYVQGMEVGKSRFFMPRWEKGFQHALRMGYRLFPAFGSDNHTLGGVKPCSPGRGADPTRGATVCWAEGLTRSGVVDAMRERRCYYSRAHRPELRIEVENEMEGNFAPMGARVSSKLKEVRVRVDVVNDLRNQATEESEHRFERLELVRVSKAKAKVIASCDFTGDASCQCVRGADGEADRCRYEGRVPAGRAAIYARVFEGETEMRCREGKGYDCPGQPAMLVGAPVFLNWER